MRDAVIEPGKHVARARRRLGFTLDLDAVATGRDIDAEAIFYRDKVAIKFTEQFAQKLGLVEKDFQSGLLPGLRLFGLSRHQRPFGWRVMQTPARRAAFQ